MSQRLHVSAVLPGTHASLTEWRNTIGTLVRTGDPRDTYYKVYTRYIRSEVLGDRHSIPDLYEALAGRPVIEPGERRRMMEITEGDDPVRRAIIGGDVYVGVVGDDGEWDGDVRVSTAAEAAEALETLERLAREPRAARWSEQVRRQVGDYIAFYRTLQPGEEVVYSW